MVSSLKSKKPGNENIQSGAFLWLVQSQHVFKLAGLDGVSVAVLILLWNPRAQYGERFAPCCRCSKNILIFF